MFLKKNTFMPQYRIRKEKTTYAGLRLFRAEKKVNGEWIIILTRFSESTINSALDSYKKDNY